jgi:hypothetical protein
VYPSEKTTRFSVSLIGNGACIHDAHLGVDPTGNRHHAVGFHLLAHALGVVLVGLAAECVKIDPPRAGQNPASRRLTVLRQNSSDTDPAERVPCSTPKSI